MPDIIQSIGNNIRLIKSDGTATDFFIRWAQQRQIDISGGITAAQAQQLIDDWAAARNITVGTGLSGGGNLSADVNISLGTVLLAYAGGDTPSAFTVSIVDSVDAATWRAAIGAGTSTVTPAALTKTDDTNVTLVLGGTPATALLQAASLTLGWTGTLSVARGGTGSSTETGARTNLGVGVPAFSASFVNTDLALTPGAFTKLPCNSEAWDIGNCYDNTTNFRFVPNVAGKYLLVCRAEVQCNSNTNPIVLLSVFKNGSEYFRGQRFDQPLTNSGGQLGPTMSCMVDANGTTDYFEAFVFYSSTAGSGFLKGPNGAQTYFQGTLQT